MALTTLILYVSQEPAYSAMRLDTFDEASQAPRASTFEEASQAPRASTLDESSQAPRASTLDEPSQASRASTLDESSQAPTLPNSAYQRLSVPISALTSDYRCLPLSTTTVYCIIPPSTALYHVYSLVPPSTAVYHLYCTLMC